MAAPSGRDGLDTLPRDEGPHPRERVVELEDASPADGARWPHRLSSLARPDLEQNGLGVGAPSPRQPDAAEPPRHHEQRRAKGVDALVEAETAVANDGRPAGEADLASVGMARQGERHAVALRLV